jgi:hypothetical protein
MLAAGLAGCGEGSPATDQFVGTWLYSDTTQSVVQCFDTAPLSEPPAPNKTFARGVGASDIVDLSVSPLERPRGIICNFAFDVSGPTARARTNQTCNLNAIDVLTIDEDGDGKPLWTFSLTSATTAQELVTSTIHIFHQAENPGDPPIEETCSWSLTADLTRIAKD